MNILSIESSCDETAAAVLDCNKDNIKVLSNIVASQIDIHKKTGGVVPEVASREHIKTILPVIKKAFTTAFGVGDLKKQLGKIDYIAVTNGPGLMGSLLVGVQTAKTLGWLANKPVVPVNHLHGHVYANFIDIKTRNKKQETRNFNTLAHCSQLSALSSIPFPAIVLIVSGGHTQLVLMKGHGKFKILGETVDDAAGEAFDKVGKLLNLEYPGGPVIEKLAKKGDPKAFAFPRPMLKHNNFDFSFSGLKTAVLYAVKQLTTDNRQLTNKELNDICASFQEAVIDVLVGKSLKAIEKHKPKSFLISGGVTANQTLINSFDNKLLATSHKPLFWHPPKELCTDNAAMIGAAAFYKLKTRNFKQKTKLDAEPNLTL